MYFLMIFAFIFIVPVIVIAVRMKRSVSPYSVIFESIVLTSVVAVSILAAAYMDSGVSLGDQLMNIVKEAAGISCFDRGICKSGGHKRPVV